MRLPLLALAAITASIIADQSAVSQDLHPGIIGKDDRVRLEAEGPPWDAVGQINTSGYRMLVECTGTLVASNIVVTAAHCVMNPATGKPYPLHTIHFVAGMRGSKYKGHAIANCLHFPKDYRYQPPEQPSPELPGRVSLASFKTDVAAIVLDSKLDVAPVPLAEDAVAEPGLKLTYVAYPADHRFWPSAHFDCRLLQSGLNGALWFNDCDTQGGGSGGPLFVKTTDDEYRLAAIMVGTAGRIANIGLAASEWTDLARNADCP
jgi:protease YdgD